jgi:hypothetical protein
MSVILDVPCNARETGSPSIPLSRSKNAKDGSRPIAYGRIPTLKEWAYAGFSIELVGAAASHAFSGDDLGHILPPVLFVGLLVTSYRLGKRQPGSALSSAPRLA